MALIELPGDQPAALKARPPAQGPALEAWFEKFSGIAVPTCQPGPRKSRYSLAELMVRCGANPPPLAARLEPGRAWRCPSRRPKSDPGPRTGLRAQGVEVNLAMHFDNIQMIVLIGRKATTFHRSGPAWVHSGLKSVRSVGTAANNRSRCVRSRIGWRQATPDQNVGAQVGAGRPNQSAAFHAHLPKSCLVVPDLGKNWTYQHWSEISLDYATVGQSELYPVVVQRLRYPNSNQSHVSSSVQWGDGF